MITHQVVQSTVHIASEGKAQWYPPVMIGAGTIKNDLFDEGYIKKAQNLVEQLTLDDYTSFLSNFYADGLCRFGKRWRYADIVTVLLCLSDNLKPQDYLEIGVRRGRSAAAVASVCPSCSLTLLDMWSQDYAGMPNPGSEFVGDELSRIGHVGERTFIDGDSHITLPKLFEENPTLAFDLITVDGDHSDLGRVSIYVLSFLGCELAAESCLTMCAIRSIPIYIKYGKS